MRKPLFLIFWLCLIVQIALGQDAQALITIDPPKRALQTILNEITQQSGYQFAYNSNLLDINERVHLPAKGWPIDQTLSLLCERLNVDYKIVEDQIVLFRPKSLIENKIYTLSGFLTDQKTGESLIGATVRVAGATQGTTTNAYGYYALPIKGGRYDIQATYLGYKNRGITIELNKDQKQNFALSPSSIDLPSVVVGSKTHQSIENKGLGRIDLPTSFLQNMPEFAGETGLVQGLQSLPGIKMHSDGSNSSICIISLRFFSPPEKPSLTPRFKNEMGRFT